MMKRIEAVITDFPPHTKTATMKTIDEPSVGKRCGNCGATVFQGPFPRGPIVDGVLRGESMFQCMGCNRVGGLADFEDYELPQAA